MVYIQGGALGAVGFEQALTASDSDAFNSISGSMTADNYYSGSLNWELSFLDKDHTIIANVDKDADLFDGIGSKGVVIIPQHVTTTVSFNIEYYLLKAGIIESTTDITQNLSSDARGD